MIGLDRGHDNTDDEKMEISRECNLGNQIKMTAPQAAMQGAEGDCGTLKANKVGEKW